MSGSDDGTSDSPARSSTGTISPARLARDAQARQVEIDSQNESMARAMAQLHEDNDLRQTAFEESRLESMHLEHLTEMKQLRVRLTEIASNADAQPPPSSRPT